MEKKKQVFSNMTDSDNNAIPLSDCDKMFIEFTNSLHDFFTYYEGDFDRFRT